MSGAVNVLMYHAICDAPGPTSIDPVTFHDQINVLTARDYEPISLHDLAA